MEMYKAEILPLKEFSDKLKLEYANILRAELEGKGYSTNHIADNDKLIIAFFTLFERRVTSKPRRVHIARGIDIDDSVKDGFEILIKKFENGEDVNPHLSTLTAKLDKSDKMFFDWGINHFHLGTELMENGFVRRTGFIAYTVVKDNDVFIVAVDQHGHWSDKNLLTVIDREWPLLIQHALVEGTFEQNFSNTEIAALRNANVNVGVNLDNGHCYLSPGRGYATDGSWLGAVFRLTDLNRILHKIHQHYEKNLMVCEDHKNRFGTKVEFTLKKIDNSIFIVEPNSSFQESITVVMPLPA